MSSEAAAMWGGAEYERIAERFAPIHDALVSALGPRPGERFLDVATGTGEVALRAARAGAAVSALDLAPALLEQARAKAVAEGLAIDWVEGNAQELPYDSGSFDAVASNFGVIFAPEPEAAAAELGRVCASGGRLGITAWLPHEGLHSVYSRFVDDAREDPTERWGARESVSELLQPWFELEIEERVWHLEAKSPEAVWELMSSGAPPVKALLDSLEPRRRNEFRAAMIEHWEGFRTNDAVSEPRGYLLVLGRRR
jgi:ubiquinone/menaquinone biosynthesis C-methylase UbiE